MTTESLKWSTQLQVALAQSKQLQGDKIILPQSALEGLLAAAPIVSLHDRLPQVHTSNFDPFNPYSFAAERHAREAVSERQQQLPHPLTFRLVNPQNGRAVYAGIREFSAEEGQVGLSTFLLKALGFSDDVNSGRTTRSGTPGSDVDMFDVTGKTPTLTIHAKQMPKGTYVKLRPLEAGYDPEDWKSLLERYLRDNFTTLTNGEILDVPGARQERFKFLVDKFEPEGDGICIVDTDLEVDIEALNEEQARETLNKKLAKTKKASSTNAGSSIGGLVTMDQELQGQVLSGEYVDYEIKKWDRGSDLEITVDSTDEADVDVLVSPFTAHQRSKPRLDEHVFADFTGQPSKRIKLSHTNVEVEEAESIFVSIHAIGQPDVEANDRQLLHYTLFVSKSISTSTNDSKTGQAEIGGDEIQCKNCRQVIPKRTTPLHEAFCYRNNVACPKCSNVFLKNSEAWKQHWHCPYDDSYGNGDVSRSNHDFIFHPKTALKCPACDYEAFNIPVLAQHRTSTCPGKEILCQFCHLIVPQQGPDDPSFTDPEVLLSGFTPHELADGARTTECHLCGKIVRLRDMRTHLRLHDRDRISKPRPVLCVNAICGRTIISGHESQAHNERLGLCDDCYGPLHSTTYDPEGKALRRRIERRLLQQLMGGCGKAWCHNAEWCRTGNKNATGDDVVMSTKDALPRVRPIIEQVNKGDASHLTFCVDEATQSRRTIAGMIAAEGVYDMQWCVRALEEERNNLGRAAEWLKDRAPKKGEVVKS